MERNIIIPKSEQKRLRDVSDRLCREYGLSVIETPKKAPSRALYFDEKSGKPTRYNVYLEDLKEAINGSRTVDAVEEYRDAWKPKQKTTEILALYYYWCYQLGTFPKGTDYKPTSPFMKEELRKMDEITAQVRYMVENNIVTISDLYAERDKNQSEMDGLIDYRRCLQNKIRRALPAEKERLRVEKQGVTEQITEIRKRLKYVKGIEERSVRIDERMNDLYENEQRARWEQYNRVEENRAKI